MRRSIVRSGLAQRSHKQRYLLKQWIDRLPDIPAFILGNAPSINEINLELLKDYFTIGVNRIFRLFDTTILMWQDISFWNTEYQHLHFLQSIKLAADGSDPKRLFYNFHLKSGGYEFKKQTHVFYGRGSTGPIACQLAYALGCRPIVLLGMDCKRGEDGRSDFWGENNFWGVETQKYCHFGLRTIKEKCPVEVYNTSPDNDVFPYEPLEDILKKVDPQKKYQLGRQKYAKMILACD